MSLLCSDDMASNNTVKMRWKIWGGECFEGEIEASRITPKIIKIIIKNVQLLILAQLCVILLSFIISSNNFISLNSVHQ